MEVTNYNTVRVELDDHDCWILAQIIKKADGFYDKKTENPFGQFAQKLNNSLAKHSKKVEA